MSTHEAAKRGEYEMNKTHRETGDKIAHSSEIIV